MKSLDDAWGWYQATKGGLRMVDRIARKGWNSWGPDGTLGKDPIVQGTEPQELRKNVEAALLELDDFAVFALFSAFEAEIRRWVLEDTRTERAGVTHPSLVYWMSEAEKAIEEGSFFTLLKSLKSPLLHNDIESVNQVRRYRNWIAHGRRGTKPDNVTPTQAYERLTHILSRLRNPAPPVA